MSKGCNQGKDNPMFRGRRQGSNGYIYDCVPGRGSIAEHILVAERALGRILPKGVPVHHVDENRSNNENSNLVICQSNSYHWLLHIRTKIVDLSGNPDMHKICSACNVMLLKFEFTRRKASPDGRHPWCQLCYRTYQRKFQTQIKERR